MDQERRLDEDQLARLRRCHDAGDPEPWNRWRREHPDDTVWLQGADLRELDLSGIDLHEARLEGAHLEETGLQGAILWAASLERAVLWHADLSRAELQGASLRRVHGERADLSGAALGGASLREAGLSDARLQGADLADADLRDADLRRADLREADLTTARLDGTRMEGTLLQGTDARRAIVDGGTLLWDCRIDEGTDFSGVGLATARMEPGLRPRLEGNVRRRLWQRWYREHPLAAIPVRFFWALSDYGLSTARLLLAALLLAVAFAAVYLTVPGLVVNLHEAAPSPGMAAVRALYFSVVTMTTLGFGDIHAAPGSAAGHLLLMAQVLLGYLLLGALVTRLSILFQTT